MNRKLQKIEILKQLGFVISIGLSPADQAVNKRACRQRRLRLIVWR
jgi:hypothetical protein